MSFTPSKSLPKLVFILITLFLHSTLALPLLWGLLPFHHHHSVSSESTTVVTQDFITSKLERPAKFARVVYCHKANVTSWDCGGPCESLGSDVHILEWGGNDGRVPSYLIAHDGSTNSIVVAHQGTNTNNFWSVLNDLNLLHTDLDGSIFSKLQRHKVTVHMGFQEAFKHTANTVLEKVQEGLTKYNSQSVLITGHSLGAAIATFDAMMLHQHLDSSIKQTVVVFGLPRVGNEHWANLVDKTIGSDFIRVSDRKDPVVNLPPRMLDFYHPSGEIHIQSVDKAGQATKVVSCPGQENKHCAEGNSIFKEHVSDHLGPYFDNIKLEQAACKMKK
ncbi:alpha/beta-hydrolase [Lentinula raphanica]|uniref:Alpha/beta-hydrolase n=1 Tax=Lentinula raphanica TaxID=153919 RepID=A0AA38U817_9AGAR|nr:alpha/beta-hydrolase [Lentinula raphanica]KAJ3824589.1 alpha/beta-hydrolase [Lentinula raphanica]KAJ3834087.1 alpha/beta-hydrolase [Lentinula raphanica]KAJ3966771.1 alpha/beta-hydrolase [Lentinula raphanica]